MLRDQSEAIFVVGVPHAEHLSPAHIVSDAARLLASTVPRNECDGVDVALEQPSQRQAPGTDLSQYLGKPTTVERIASKFQWK